MEKEAFLNSPSHRTVEVLFFFSGTTGLILQVVWLYKLGLIFGNASYATAATLSSFFLGLALGGKYWGRKSSQLARPLRLYGFLELGIALSALLILPGFEFYQHIYGDVIQLVGHNKLMLTLVKFFFSLLVLLVPTVLMGGTFPVLSQFIGRSSLAPRATLLYTLNTLGATIGTSLAGFFLFIQLGVHGTYIVSVCLAGLTGIIAIILDKNITDQEIQKNQLAPEKSSIQKSSSISISQFRVLAISTGLLALAAETAWIKMFTQVLQNSVYSFSVVLVVFLSSLAIGGAYAHYLVKRSYKIQNVLFFLLLFSAFFVGCTPLVFDYLTDGLTYIGSMSSWIEYLISIFWLGFMVIGIPTIVLGTLFPYLIKSNSTLNLIPGSFIGNMVFLNSLGSAIGPLILGFVLIDWIGVWMSIKMIALGYLLLAGFLLKSSKMEHASWKIAMPFLASVCILFFTSPPLVKLEKGEQLVAAWQSVDGIVSVIRSNDNIDIRLNNTYILGDAKSALVEQMQANVPLLLHSKPEKVLFLGMGTGITAGAALNFPVNQVDVVEIISDVIPASRNYFSPWTNNLFSDNRVNIVTDDARNYLLGVNEKYDVIIGDLFSPWHSGTGSLYSLEHFELIESKLDADGYFAQWLPLYQLTNENFESIVATFTEVFPTVTFWRADFSNTKPSIVLVGQKPNTIINNELLLRNSKYVVGKENSDNFHMAGLFYLGNIEAIRSKIEKAPINTDDKRTIEFSAPITTQQARAGQASFLTGLTQVKLYNDLRKLPIDKDPYLKNLPSKELVFVEVGHLYFNYMMVKDKDIDKADSIINAIRTLAPDFL